MEVLELLYSLARHCGSAAVTMETCPSCLADNDHDNSLRDAGQRENLCLLQVVVDHVKSHRYTK